MDSRLLEILACPICKGPLKFQRDAQVLVCRTDRIAEVARAKRWSDADVAVNVQGDEPLMPHALIDQVAGLLLHDADAGMATLAAPLGRIEELLDPNIVKVVADAQGRALYFSR